MASSKRRTEEEEQSTDPSSEDDFEEEESSDDEDSFGKRCDEMSGFGFDEIAGFGFDEMSDLGFDDARIKLLAMEHAQRMMKRAGNVADFVSSVSEVRTAVLSCIGLPRSVQIHVRSFLPPPETELVGRLMLGLHNAHDYYFHSLAPLPAGELLCTSGDKRVTVAEYYAELGHPVAASARVAKASRGEYNEFEAHCAVPLDFAVLVPGGASPAGSLQDLFQGCEDWFEDAELEEESEESVIDSDMEDAGCSSSNNSNNKNNSKNNNKSNNNNNNNNKTDRVPQATTGSTHPSSLQNNNNSSSNNNNDTNNNTPSSLQNIPATAKDRHLFFAASFSGPHSTWKPVGEGKALEGVGLKTVRKLLSDGANPLFRTSLDGPDVPGVAAAAKASLRKHIDGMLAGTTSVHAAFWGESSFAEVRYEAASLLKEEAKLGESVAVLATAASFWAAAAPAARPICIGGQVRGSGVPAPDFEAMGAAVAEVPKRVPLRCKGVDTLALAMWELLEVVRATAQEDWLREEETAAMAKEDWLMKLLWKERCCCCRRCVPDIAFSRRQAKKSASLRCCMECIVPRIVE